MNYGFAIQTARELQELSKRELARRSHLHPSYITHIERGRKKPSLDALEQIAEALGLTLLQLLHFGAHS